MSLLSILSRVTSDSRLRVEDPRERSTVSGIDIPRPTALMKRAELSGRPTALLGLVVATWQSRRIVRGSAEFVLVNQRGWFVDNDGSAGTCVVGFTLLEALLGVCSLTLSSRRLSFKFA